jgi:hypothetical protein
MQLQAPLKNVENLGPDRKVSGKLCLEIWGAA